MKYNLPYHQILPGRRFSLSWPPSYINLHSVASVIYTSSFSTATMCHIIAIIHECWSQDCVVELHCWVRRCNNFGTPQGCTENVFTVGHLWRVCSECQIEFEATPNQLSAVSAAEVALLEEAMFRSLGWDDGADIAFVLAGRS